MDVLLLCEYCRHGATLHEGGGCTARRCGCTATRETIVSETLAKAKDDIHNAYR